MKKYCLDCKHQTVALNMTCLECISTANKQNYKCKWSTNKQMLVESSQTADILVELFNSIKFRQASDQRKFINKWLEEKPE